MLKKIKYFIPFVFLFTFFIGFNASASSLDVPSRSKNPVNDDKYYIHTISLMGNESIYTYNTVGTPESNKWYTNEAKYYAKENGEWVYKYTSTFSFRIDTAVSYFSEIITNDKTYYDCLTSVGFKNVSFNIPPLVGAVKGVEMGAVMTVIKEIAPIVVLSIVSFLALRKAWRFCLSQLKSS